LGILHFTQIIANYTLTTFSLLLPPSSDLPTRMF